MIAMVFKISVLENNIYNQIFQKQTKNKSKTLAI